MPSKKEVIPVIAKKTKQPLSRLQKQFNTRTRKVKKLKTELDGLEEAIPEIRSKCQELLEPIRAEIVEVRTQTIFVFDKAYQMKFFRSKEKEKLAALITEHAYELIDTHGKEELREVYDRYAELSFEEEKEATDAMSKDMMKNMMKNMTGVDLDLDDVDDMNDFEQLSRKMFESMSKQKEQEEEDKKKRKKTKAQIAKEKRLEEEAKHISKTSKTIYNELVKTYHPDREQDEVKREEKTKVMQQITEAYQNDDFFELLKFQLQLREGTEHLEELPEDHLKYYNKILKEQVDELTAKLQMLKNPPPPYNELGKYLQNYKNFEKILEWDVLALEKDLQQYEEEIEIFKDKKQLRGFLKTIDLEPQNDFDDLFFSTGLDLGSIFDEDDDEPSFF